MVGTNVILSQLMIWPETFPSSSINSSPVSVTSLPATLKIMKSRIHWFWATLCHYCVETSFSRIRIFRYTTHNAYNFATKSSLHNLLKFMIWSILIGEELLSFMSLTHLSLISFGQLTPICWRMTSSVTWPSSRTWAKIPELLLSWHVIGQCSGFLNSMFCNWIVSDLNLLQQGNYPIH